MQTNVITESRPSLPDLLPDFAAPPADYLDVGHSRLAYRRVGSGPDLLFVHGWPLHAGTFRKILPALAQRHTCHLIDLPGAGFTRVTAESPIDMRSHSDTLERAIAEIGLDRYAMIAHDSGGLFARTVAARHGDRVRALVLGNTEVPRHHSWLIHALVRGLETPAGRAAMMLMMRTRWLRRSAIGFGGCFSDLDLLDGEFHELFVEPSLSDERVAALQLRLAEGFDFSTVDELEDLHRAITAPVLLIWGADDPFFPLDKARQMPSQFPGGAELEVLRPGKLLVHEEQPERFAQLTMQFLKRHT